MRGASCLRGGREGSGEQLPICASGLLPPAQRPPGRESSRGMALCAGSGALRGYSYLEVWESPARVMLSEGAVLVAAVT